MGYLLDGFGGLIDPGTVAASYNPASFFTGGTSGPWLDPGNSTNVLNGSGTPATAGQTVGTINDSGTAAINATQGTDANRPTLAAAHVNSRNAIQLTSAQVMSISGMNAFSNGMTSMTVLVVFNPTDGSTNHRPFRQYDTTFSYNRVICSLSITGLRSQIAYSKDGGDFANSRNSAADLTAASYRAIIFQIDCTNGKTAVFVDNSDGSTTTEVSYAAAGGGTVAGTMSATAAAGSEVFAASKGYYADLYIHKNALMTAPQRAAWFAAVKSRFSLSGY